MALGLEDSVCGDGRFHGLFAGRELTADECADRARRAAELVDVAALDRAGAGEALLLWREPHSEAWLNLWWQSRDTGDHDHDGSAVGVHVIEGRAWNEPLVTGTPRRVREYGPGDSFAFSGHGIHRMDHEPGAITIHVYSPPLRAIGHFELHDGELWRQPTPAGEASAPSPGLIARLDEIQPMISSGRREPRATAATIGPGRLFRAPSSGSTIRTTRATRAGRKRSPARLCP